MKFVKIAAAAAVGIGLALAPVSAQAAPPKAQASGSVKQNDGVRKFSFNAKVSADGTVRGQARLVNTGFAGDDGKPFRATMDISCMKVVGNIAVFGGIVQSNDANLDDEAAYFTAQDNGKSGKRDKVSALFFFDEFPTTKGDPQACLNTGPNDFDLNAIESGNIKVK
jgi:hypothetical protein